MKFSMVTRVGEGRVCKVQALSVPRGWTPALPNFGLPPAYAHATRRTIKFDVVTYGEGRVLGGQPRYCISLKYFAQFVRGG